MVDNQISAVRYDYVIPKFDVYDIGMILRFWDMFRVYHPVSLKHYPNVSKNKERLDSKKTLDEMDLNKDICYICFPFFRECITSTKRFYGVVFFLDDKKMVCEFINQEGQLSSSVYEAEYAIKESDADYDPEKNSVLTVATVISHQ